MKEAIKKYKEDLEEEAIELAEVREDVLKMKGDVNFAALGGLLTTLKDGVEELLEVVQTKENYDKDLGSTLKETISQLVAGFSKIKSPIVNVAAPDLTQLNGIASDISSQNKVIVNLVERMNSTNDNGELYRLIVAMVGRNNAFIEKGMQAADYTKQLDRIGDGLNKVPIAWEGEVTAWKNDRLHKFSIKPKQ